MNRNEPSISPESLLEHTLWVNKLAASLVGEDRADDLVQDVWLAALKRPCVKAPRAWLATVVRNLANVTRRSEYARRRRELLVAARRETDSSSAEKTMERYELQRQIVELVGQLEEPYRSTVLLKYFEELSPKEIASRQHVAVTTVRSHLTKALEKLRCELDRAHGGKRQVWLKVLVPTAGLGAVSSSAPAVAAQSWTADVAGNGAVSALSIGAAAMKFKVAGFLAVSTIALAGGIGIGRLMPPASSDSSSRFQAALQDLQQHYDVLKRERDELEAQRTSESMKVQSLEQQLATLKTRLDEERPVVAEEPEDKELLRKKLALLRDWLDAHPDDRVTSESAWAEYAGSFQQAAAGIRELIPSDPKSFFDFFNAQDDSRFLLCISRFILNNWRISQDGGRVVGNLRFADLEPSIEAGILETLNNGSGMPLRMALDCTVRLSGDVPTSFREAFWRILFDEAVEHVEKRYALSGIAKGPIASIASQTRAPPEEQERILRYAQGLTEPLLVGQTVKLFRRIEPSEAAETLFDMFPGVGVNPEARDYISKALSDTFRRMASDDSGGYEEPLQRAFLKENSELSFYYLVDAALSLPPDQALRLLRTAETNMPSERVKSGLQAVLTRLEGGERSSRALHAAYSEASGSMLRDLSDAQREANKRLYERLSNE